MSKLDAKFGQDSCKTRLPLMKDTWYTATDLSMIDCVRVRPMKVPRYAIAICDGVETLQPFREATKPALFVLNGLMKVPLIIDL